MLRTIYQTKLYNDIFETGETEIMPDVFGRADSRKTVVDGTLLKFSDFKNVLKTLRGNRKYVLLTQCYLDEPLGDLKYAVPSLDDHVLDLSKFIDSDSYLKSLGKKTREHLKQYKKRLLKYAAEQDATVEFCYLSQNDDSELIKKASFEIYKLNEARCLSKGYHSGVNQKWIDLFPNNCRIVYCSYKEKNLPEKIIGGGICTVVDQIACFHMIAHDDEFGRFNIGNLCLFELISHLISEKVRTFHFLWGDSEYKERFGGEHIQLYNVYSARDPFELFLIKIKTFPDILRNRINKDKSKLKKYLFKKGKLKNIRELRKKIRLIKN